MRPRPAPNRQILAEASEWFAAFRFDDVDAGERQRFGEWLRRSPEHIQAYLDLSQLWAGMPGEEARGKFDVDDLIARARVAEGDVLTFDVRPVPEVRRQRVVWRPSLLVASAAVALGVVAVTLAAWLWVGRYPVYTTGIGEQRSITLADGSSLDLNSASRVRVRFARTVREVDLLAGQALFRVAKDKQRPFVVVAGARQVIAVGTQFDVYRRDGSTIVTVLEGRVAVTPAVRDFAPALAPVASIDSAAVLAGEHANLLLVSAGEQAVVTGQSAAKPRRADVAAATAWVQKKLVFDATPLARVVEEFNRYNTRRLSVEDPQLATLGISGVYTSTDPSSLLNFLRDQSGVRIVETPEAVRITSAGP